MATIAKGQKEFEKVPSGTHVGVCTNVYDLGLQETTFQGEVSIKHQVILRWELSATRKEGDFIGQRFFITRKYTMSLNEKSNLRKDIKSWLGRDLTDEEVLLGYDIDQLIGQSCLVGITHADSKGRTYANISSVMALPDNLKPLIQENKSDVMPKWIQEAIEKQITETVDQTLPKDEDVPDEDIPF